MIARLSISGQNPALRRFPKSFPKGNLMKSASLFRLFPVSLAVVVCELACSSSLFAATTYVSNLNEAAFNGVALGSNRFLARSFTTGNAPDGYTLSSVQIIAGMNGSPSGDFQLFIYSDAGGVPGASIAQLTGPNPSAFDTYTYTGSVPLLPFSSYWIVATATQPHGDTDFYFWEYPGNSNYTAIEGWSLGGSQRSADGGTSWVDQGSPFYLAVNAVVSGCTPAPPDMISWWPGDGNANDQQGSNHGSLQDDATFGLGKVGQAFSFDGDGDYVQISSDPSLNPDNLTLDLWVYLDDTAGSRGVFWRGNHTLLLEIQEGLAKFGSKDSAGDYSEFTGSIPILAGVWTHIALTHDGSTRKIYINGTLDTPSGDPADANQAGLFTGNTDNITIGARFTGDVQFFDGLIDEVEVLGRALSQPEIQAIVDAGSAGKCKPCAPPPANMVGWWPGDGNADDIQDSNHGSLMGGTTFAAGEVDQGFSMDGLNDFVQIPDSASLSVTSAITIDAWVKPDTVTGLAAGRTIVSKYDTGVADQYSYRLFVADGGQVGFAVYNNNASGAFRYVVTTGTVAPGVFTHVAATFDATTQAIKIYLNGVDTAAPLGAGSTTVDPILDSTTPVRIGAHKEGANVTGFFDGVLDEVEIFDRALSATEIAAIYNAGTAGKCKCTEPPENMTGWWPGEGNLDDIVGGYDGTGDESPSFSPGVVGMAMDFDGTEDTVTVAGFPDPNVAYSFDAWVYWRGVILNGSSHDGILVKTQDSGGADSYAMFIYEPDHSLYNIVGDGAVNTPSGSVPVNEWFHVAQTYDGSTVKVYINGVLAASTTGDRAPSSGVLAFATRQGVQHFMNGLLDEIEIFSRALSEDEVRAIYNAGSAGKCKPASICTTYSGSFTQSQPASAQAAQDWSNFRASLDPSAYDTVTISGTFDTTGRTLTDAAIVPQIADALQNGTSFSAVADGFTWNVGGCGNELNASTGEVSCSCLGGADSYVIRPNIGNENWGGVNSDTCNGPSQTITVTFCGPPPPVPAERQFANISGRANVGIGQNVAIAGFIIQTDPPSSSRVGIRGGGGGPTKTVLIRGIGPSLAAQGVSGFLADPVLSLRGSDGTVLASNDDWQSDQETAINNTGLAPNDPREAAILATLASDTNYTAILRGEDPDTGEPATGIGLVEVYDLDATGSTHLANISARALVSTGSDVLIGGLIVQGGTPARVVLRAIGPSLAGPNVSNPLLDPMLALHDANGALLEANDDWPTSSQAAEITASGLQPNSLKESAILFTPAPGNYTAIVSGAGGSSGVGLVEAYNIGPPPP